MVHGIWFDATPFIDAAEPVIAVSKSRSRSKLPIEILEKLAYLRVNGGFRNFIIRQTAIATDGTTSVTLYPTPWLLDLAAAARAVAA
jgi:hypothetical protein